MADVQVSFCVVNTAQRELLLRGLDAIAAERAALPFPTETIVLDNCSQDGSAEAARAHPTVDRVIALPRRTGKAANDSQLLREARGVYALLLNEDAELMPGAVRALHDALEHDAGAACAGAALLRPDGSPQPCAWRFPTLWTALAGALFLHRLVTVQSAGARTRRVDWCQSSALLVRRSAAERVGFLDPDFFVYSDEVDFARRLRDAGWGSLYVPAAVAVHHEQLSTGAVPERRIVEFARNRDLYMRKHHGAAQALIFRWLTALPYALRALAALALPGHSARRYLAHVRATLAPGRGEGLREAAEAYNRALGERAERLDVESYDRLVASGALEGQRVELLDGAIVDVSPQSPIHAAVLEALAAHFAGARLRKRVQMPLEIGPDSEPEPDLALVQEAVAADHHPRSAALVVEVSVGSQAVDRNVKARLYARAGIPVYWLIDVPARTVEVRTDPRGGEYTSVQIHRSGETVPCPLEGVADLDVAALLANVAD